MTGRTRLPKIPPAGQRALALLLGLALIPALALSPELAPRWRLSDPPAGGSAPAGEAVRPGPPKAAPLPEARRFLLGLPLDLNRATAKELTLLPGIGPARAAGIVALRRARGGLGSVKDLLAVPGLGPELVARLAPLAACGPEDGPGD